jgi:hypothetical protein
LALLVIGLMALSRYRLAHLRASIWRFAQCLFPT